MNLNLAIRYALLVQAAYSYTPPPALPSPLPAIYDIDNLGYQIIAVISADDLWTDINILFPVGRVPIGLVLLDKNNDAVIAIRGTEGIFEWVHDALYLQKPCPFAGGVGNSEDGFTQMYTSLQVGSAGGAPPLVAALPHLPWTVANLKSLTVCGHSLGSSIATLLAYDVALNCAVAAFKPPTVYTFASPRTGDPVFAMNYDRLLPATYRVANDVDLVPHLPAEVPIAQIPFYHHVGEVYTLQPFGPAPACQSLMQRTVKCHHVIESYLHLLYVAAGISPPYELTLDCVVPVGTTPRVPGTGIAVM